MKNIVKKFGILNQGQTDGLNNLLWGYETYHGWWDNIDQIAHSLSEIRHETNRSFQPVVEGYYLGDGTKPNYNIGNTERVKAFHRSLRYNPHFGRGHIQLTWAENYAEQDALIKKYFPELVEDFERRIGKPLDLIKFPHHALDPKISFAIMTIGMHKGTFREGHTLDRYINNNIIDHFNARNIVNGDRNYKIKHTNTKIGTQIEEDAKKFAEILKVSELKPVAEELVVEEPAADQPVTGAPPSSEMTEQIEAPTVREEPVTPVPQVVAETTDKEPTTGIKGSVAAAITFLSTSGAGAFGLFSGVAPIFVISFFAAATVVGIVFISWKMYTTNRQRERENELREAREKRAHEIQVLQLQSAMNKDLNTVRVVPQPMGNSDAS